MELSQDSQTTLKATLGKMLADLPNLRGITHITPHLDTIAKRAERAIAALKESGYTRGSREVKRLTTLGNSAISLKEGIASRDVESEHVEDFKTEARDTLRHLLEEVNKASAPAVSAVVNDVEAEQAVAAMMDAEDNKALLDALRKRIREQEEWDGIQDVFKRNARLASDMPKANKRTSFRLMRLPVVPIVEGGYYNIEKLARSSLKADDIDGRYFSLPHQLILAYNPNYEPDEDDSVGDLVKERNREIRRARKSKVTVDIDSATEVLKQEYEEFIKREMAKVPQRLKELEAAEIKEGGKKWTKAIRAEKEKAMRQDITSRATLVQGDKLSKLKAQEERERDAGKHKPTYTDEKETRFGLVLKGIESRLGEKLVQMPGAAKFRASGFVYYWLMTETQVNTLRNSAVGSPVIEQWGFPFK